MKKIIKEVDEKRGIMQITVADERWYTKPSRHPETDMPVYIPVPSVTWIAGYWPKGIGFYKWLADKGWDEAEAAKQAAGDKGSVVHLACEMIINGEEFRIDTKVADRSRSTEQETFLRELTYEELLGVKSFIDWKADMEKEYIIETIASEKTLISDEYKCGGTADWVIRLTHKETGAQTLWLIDFKTSKQIWTEYELQISAYCRLLQNGENPISLMNENGTESNETIDFSGLKMGILQLGYERNKNGYKFTEIESSFDDFLVAQKIWEREIGDGMPGFTVRDFPIFLSPGVKKEDLAETMVADPVEDVLEMVEEQSQLPVGRKSRKA